MMAMRQRFSLNPAQERNLRKWSRAELMSQAFSVVIPLQVPWPLESVRSAVRRLAGRHGALRSQITYQPDGTPVQQVRSLDETLASLDWDIVTAPGRSATSAGHWCPEDVDPEERAFRCSLLVEDDRVASVRLSVSHMFTDGIGADILVRDFMRLLQGHPVTPEAPLQPDAYSRDLLAEKIRSNTEYWKDLLSGAPRSCTYAASRRDPHEIMQLAEVQLDRAQSAAIVAAASWLRVTEYCLWSAAASGLVQAITGQFTQVFRSTYANRFSVDDANAVAQLAQAVFLPISGAGTDTLAQRAVNLFGMTMETYRRGIYDANELLDWLNQPPELRGAIFQPAFEVNYLPPLVNAGPAAQPWPLGPRVSAPRVSAETVRVNPPSAKADLAIQIISPGHGEICPRVRLWARRPVYSQRRAPDLLKDLLKVMQRICAAPDSTVEDLPVERFGSATRLSGGHRSGVAFDPGIMRHMLLQLPGVCDCGLSMRHGALVANLQVRDDMRRQSNAAEMLGALHSRQQWFSGSVVPDEIVIG